VLKIKTLATTEPRENWYDSSEENPHPVTTEDVLFTFQTIQDPNFPNPILHENFRGVTVEKLDDLTVRFTLDQPYSFFSSNLALGLLPKRHFEGIPASKMDQTVDFGFAPIGAGPYKFKSTVETDLSTEVTLERFDRAMEPKFQLEQVVFRIFPDYPTLLSDLRNLDGVRSVARGENGDLLVPRRFEPLSYTLPQYVALFFNLDRELFKDQQLRLGLQLGTDKQEIVDAIHEEKIVDTPLLEIDTSDWRYHFDAEAAQGSIFESRWFVPERIRLQTLQERKNTNDVGLLRVPSITYLQTGSVLTLTGSYGDIAPGWKINGVPIETIESNSGSWIVKLTTHSGTGVLKPGDTLLRLTNESNRVEDSAYVFRAADAQTYARALEEQKLFYLYESSKNQQADSNDKITTQNIFLDHGFLRRRKSEDPISVRRNERGDLLRLTLLTSPAPGTYAQVAEIIRDQWMELGADVSIVVPATREEFESRLLRRDYDVLLFGQSLLDNLDSYPYWHSNGVQKVTGKEQDLRRDAYNLSQYSSFKADALLETIRSTQDEDERLEALQSLRDVLKNDVPAIFLYSPLYTYAHHHQIQGVTLGTLSVHSDRFLNVHDWYVKQDRVFKLGTSWLSFFSWLPSLL
jgi:ABC-type transport system substrate-binding protein